MYQFLKLEQQLISRTNQFGLSYYLIPLINPKDQDALNFHDGTKLTILEQHLSAYETLTPETEYSDIHYTVVLQAESELLKAHVFFNADNHCTLVKLKNLAHPEEKFVIHPHDVGLLKNLAYHQTGTVLVELRDKKSRMLLGYEQAYNEQLQQLEQCLFEAMGSMEEEQGIVAELFNTLEPASLLAPLKYQKACKRFQKYLELFNTPQPKQEHLSSTEAHKEEITEVDDLDSKNPITLVFFGPKRNHFNEYLIHTLQDLNHIQQIIRQKTVKVIRHSESNSLSISDEFIQQVNEVQELIQKLHLQLISLNEQRILPCHQKNFSRIMLEISKVEQAEHEISLDLLKTMLVTSDFKHLNMVKHKARYLPKKVFYSLIDKDEAQILWTLIEASGISIYTPLISEKSYGLIEEIIRTNKYACFSEIYAKIDINLLMPCADARPLISLIFKLNPVNRIRSLCTNTHPQINSVYFINQAKKALVEYTQKTPNPCNIEQDLLMLESFKGVNSLSKQSALTIDAKESSFFNFIREQSEAKSFLNAPWVQETLIDYARKQDAFREKLKRTHQFHSHRASRKEYEDSLPEERINRIKSLFETMTESDVRMSLENLHTHIDLSSQYFDINEDIRLHHKSMGKNKLKALYKQADALKEKIDRCEGKMPKNSTGQQYPGIREPLLSVFKQIDVLSYQYELSKDPNLIPIIMQEIAQAETLNDCITPENLDFFVDFMNVVMLRLFTSPHASAKP